MLKNQGFLKFEPVPNVKEKTDGHLINNEDLRKQSSLKKISRFFSNSDFQKKFNKFLISSDSE